MNREIHLSLDPTTCYTLIHNLRIPILHLPWKKLNLDIYGCVNNTNDLSLTHPVSTELPVYRVITRRHSRMRGKNLQWKQMLLTGEANASSTPEGTYQVCPAYRKSKCFVHHGRHLPSVPSPSLNH